MTRGWFLVLSALAVLGAPRQGLAGSRRALVVGIDEYQPQEAGPPGRWSDLEGAVNAAAAIASVLRARYGFEVRRLTNGDATRERMLAEITSFLADGAKPGDARVFFFAGHGSQVTNSLSPERDKLDETLVPADSALGARDLRDKELARAWNGVLEKGATLTVILDSCHSGSGARGAGARMGKARSLPPDLRDVKDGSAVEAPESRGALVLAAAQDYQLALETDGTEEPHGFFSWSLLRVLRSAPPNESAERVFSRIRALMQAEGRLQDPVIAGSDERRRAPVFGGLATARAAYVTVVEAESPDRVVLDAGRELGLRVGTLLRRVPGPGEKGGPVRLEIARAEGIGGCEARQTEGEGKLLPGDLFEVEAWAPPDETSLRVLMPAPLPVGAKVLAAVATLQALKRERHVVLEEDLLSAPVCNVLRWQKGQWLLQGPGGVEHLLGAAPSAKAIAPKLVSCEGRTRVLWLLPPSAELGAGLAESFRASPGIELTDDPAKAHYQLAGRVRGKALEYAWVRMELGPAATPAAMPGETRWIPGGEDAAAPLAQLALSLARIRAWLTLETPGDSGAFPYRLALRSTQGGAALDRSSTVRDGEEYALALVRDAEQSAPVEPRWVYAFVIDSAGTSQLLFPPSIHGSVENRLPRAGPGGPPEALDLGEPFTVSPPFGTDTFLLLTTDTPIANLAVFESDGVRGEVPKNPLESLLFRTGAGHRGSGERVPARWSLDRLSMTSLSAK